MKMAVALHVIAWIEIDAGIAVVIETSTLHYM